MSYITISELPELLQTDVNGEEYFLITDANNNSTRIKMSTLADYVGSVEVQPLSIQDEGVSIGTTNVINFIGADVSSYVNNNKNRIDVYIPSAQVSSNFNTLNGQTSPLVENNSTIYNRYVGLSERYFIGNWSKSTKYSVVNDVLNFSVTDYFKVVTDGKIIVKIINDTEHSIETFTDSNKTITENNITLSITDYKEELSYNICKLSVSVDINKITSGRFRVEIINLVNSEVFKYVSDELFCDNSQEQANVSFDFNLSSETYKYLSGVRFLGYGTKIDYSADLSYINSYSYPDNILDIDATLSGLNLYNISRTNFPVYEGNENSIEKYSFSNNININKYFNGNITIKSRVNDWSTGSWNSLTKRAIIDTYIDNSTRVYEDFVSETNRIGLNMASFDSHAILEDGELQVLNSRLVYPQLNFTEFQGPDYSGKTGMRSYIRRFWHSGVSHSNGTIQFNSNLTESDISSGNIKIEISLDSTSWYSLNSEYYGGIINNGDGCRINSDTNSLNSGKLEFTLGLNRFTSVDSNWGIYIKISFLEASKNKYIDSLQITNWN